MISQAIGIACGQTCRQHPVYVRDGLMDIDSLADQEAMPAGVSAAIAALLPDVTFADSDQADAILPDVDAGEAVLVNVSPVYELADEVVGVDVGISLMAFQGETIQFKWDGTAWAVTDSDETGVTVTSVVS
jgi:hypothetical protein